MRAGGISGVLPRKRRRTTVRLPGLRVAPDLSADGRVEGVGENALGFCSAHVFGQPAMQDDSVLGEEGLERVSDLGLVGQGGG
jgi:hypothetical protein